jgi:hypothetical protein
MRWPCAVFAASEANMQIMKTIIIAILMSLSGTVASCGTMGGGGMHYLVEPPPVTSALT